MYDGGTLIYSVCSDSVMLAESGLLDGCDATLHLGFSQRNVLPQRTLASGWVIRSPHLSGACSSVARAWPRGSIGTCFSRCGKATVAD